MVGTGRLRVQSSGNNDVIDITQDVNNEVAKTGIRAGEATVFVVGSTAGITTMEFEPGLVSDLKEFFSRLVPSEGSYQHNLRWGDDNGHSHLRSSLLGTSLSIPLIDGRLSLGTWQQIVLVDFDIRPRRRDIVVQVLGDQVVQR